MSEPKMFYCGCNRDVGHYVWRENGQRLSWRETGTEQPWGDSLDGELCPPKGSANGLAKYTVRYGWSALSWWDNSIDSRPGSHSTFIVEGRHFPEEVLEMARRRFPWVFARLKYAVTIDCSDHEVMRIPSDCRDCSFYKHERTSEWCAHPTAPVEWAHGGAPPPADCALRRLK